MPGEPNLKAMSSQSDTSSNVAVAQAVERIRVAMLTTHEQAGGLRSRPMVCVGLDQDALWFITKEHTGKVDEAQRQHAVNVTFAAPDQDAYVSITGQAEIVHDQQLMQKLWQPDLTRWFPQGTHAADMALLRVDIQHAEHWNLAQS